MISKAKDVKTGLLVTVENVKKDFVKGDYVCQYCEVPLTPVTADETSRIPYWRIYPGQDHLLGYCRTIAEKNGMIHDPRSPITKELNFFTNYYRPEKEYHQKSEDVLLPSDGLSVDSNDIKPDDESNQSIDDNLPSENSLPCINGETEEEEEDEEKEKRKEENPKEIKNETSVSRLSQLYDEKFHLSRLDTPMFTSTRGDYMVLANNVDEYLEKHENKIKGFKIVEAIFTGFSYKENKLFFEVRSEKSKPGEGIIPLRARIELFCKDTEYFQNVLLSNYFIKTDNNGKFSYRYRKVIAWIRARFDWEPTASCKKCSYYALYSNKYPSCCESCKGLMSGNINTSAQLLFTKWKGNNGIWNNRESEKEKKK